MNLIYIGDHFYMASGTMMSCIYTERGTRSDWGHVQSALRHGETIQIRPATEAERNHYEAQLAELKRERIKREETHNGYGVYRVAKRRRPPRRSYGGFHPCKG